MAKAKINNNYTKDNKIRLTEKLTGSEQNRRKTNSKDTKQRS